jgi:uncharacterized lipoprotein YmbA
MNKNKRSGIASLLLGGMVLLSACGTSQPTRYYVLSSLADVETETAPRSDLAIGVGPVKLPEYLDRHQIVSRQTDHELKVSVLDHWAEPLRVSLSRVLRENLGILLGTDAVFVFPWKFATDIDYQVTVVFHRFEADAENRLVLHAQWKIISDRKPVLVRKSVLRESAETTDYAARAAAASRALAQLSREIATAIEQIETSKN